VSRWGVVGLLTLTAAAAAAGATVTLRMARRHGVRSSVPHRQPAPVAAAPDSLVSTTLPARPRIRTAIRPAVAIPAPARAAAPAPESAPIAPAAPAPLARLNLEPVEAPATPRSVQVVAIPVPTDLLSGGNVQYQVLPEGNAHLVGALSGTVVVTSGQTARPVVVAASLPKMSPAGLQNVARVQFSQSGAVRGEVLVRLNVLTVHSALVRLSQTVLGGHAGERISLRYFVTNTGNATDTMAVRLLAPVGWRVDGAPTSVVIMAGATATQEIGLWVPREAGIGSLRLGLVVAAGGRDVARADADIEVVAGSLLAGGPTLEVNSGVASVLTSRTSSPVFQVDATGPIAHGLSLSGRFIQATNTVTADPLSLARVGYFLGGSYLTLAAPHWQGTAGATGRAFSDITGINAYGRGASFTFDDTKYTADVLGASPSVGTQTSGGHLFGARVGMHVDGGWVGATATDFRDSVFTARQLSAIGVGGISPSFSGFTMSGELAHRSYAGGSGLGWSAQLDQRSPDNQLQLKALSAPGGANAYARAQSEFDALAAHRIGSLDLNASAFVSNDHSSAFAKLQSIGWSFSPRYELNPHLSLNLSVHGNSYTAVGNVGTFGSTETAVRAGAVTHWGLFYATGALSAGQVSRSTQLSGAPSIVDAGGRYGLEGTMGASTDRGNFEAGLSYDQSAARVGYLPHEALLSFRADNVPAWGNSRIHAEVQQYVWFGALPSATLVRLGVVMPLPADLRLTVDIQHNPLLTGPTGGNRWVPVVKLEHSLSVETGASHALLHGTVYEDRNGNGARDRNEPGVAGVVIRRGGETTVSDKNGAFTLYQETTERLRVDETSLPFGEVANPASELQSVDQRRVEIGVWPTQSVDVRLVPTADETGRVPRVDFRNASMSAVDSAGNAWSARADSTGAAHFDALPPGTYHLEFQLQDVKEPVHTTGPAPVFVVKPGQSVPAIRVPVLPRPVRLFDPTNQRGRGATVGHG